MSHCLSQIPTVEIWLESFCKDLTESRLFLFLTIFGFTD